MPIVCAAQVPLEATPVVSACALSRRMDESFGTVQAGASTMKTVIARTWILMVELSCWLDGALRILRNGLAVDDSRGDEDQQLLPVVSFGGGAEEEAQNGNLAEEWNGGD